MENPIEIDDLGVPPFEETSMMSGSSWSLQPTKLAPDCDPSGSWWVHSPFGTSWWREGERRFNK